MALSASWEETGAHRLAPAGGLARRRAFATARRHSRHVRFLRVFLPIAGLLVIAAFLVKTNLALPGDIDLSAASLSVTRNSIIMNGPHLTGFDGDRRKYSLSADRAVQPLSRPGEIRLEEIEAKITEAGQRPTSITAEAGDYDHEKSTLQLLGAIGIDSAEGYRLEMTEATVDFDAGTMVSENPVAIGYAESEITGQRLSVSDGGKLIVIEGAVRTVLMPPKRPPESAAPAAPFAPAAE